VKIWFQNRRARERRDKGGTQLQQSTVQKSFQPLTIPTVSWSVPTASNYVHYQQTLDFRSRYLVPSLGMYNTPEGNQVTEDCRDMKLHHLTDIQ
ncbi:homeobox protein MSH-D, partial [Biomphalaria pfeifferi]